MKVELSKVYPMEVATAQAWALLQDVEATAGCMPGAEITEQVDENNYKGTVTVKLGPVSATFNGDIEVKGMDEEKRQIRLLGKGADKKGSSSASMDLTASIRDADPHCELLGDAEVTVNGKMVSFGGRMMHQVADRYLNQFARNFADKVPPQAGGAAPTSEAEAAREHGLNGPALAWHAIVERAKSLFGARK